MANDSLSESLILPNVRSFTWYYVNGEKETESVLHSYGPDKKLYDFPLHIVEKCVFSDGPNNVICEKEAANIKIPLESLKFRKPGKHWRDKGFIKSGTFEQGGWVIKLLVTKENRCQIEHAGHSNGPYLLWHIADEASRVADQREVVKKAKRALEEEEKHLDDFMKKFKTSFDHFFPVAQQKEQS